MTICVEEYWTIGNANAADELIAANVIDHQLLPSQTHGRESYKQLVSEWRLGFPDLRESVEAIVTQADIAVGAVGFGALTPARPRNRGHRPPATTIPARLHPHRIGRRLATVKRQIADRCIRRRPG
jgi:hypothetical protein